MRRPCGRRGSGLIVGAVAIVLVLLLLLGLHEILVSSTVLDEVGSEHFGSLAITLAESALEEVQLALRQAANDPARAGGAVYALFRKPLVYEVEAGESLAAVADAAVATRAMLTQREFAPAGFELAVDAPRVVYRALYDAGRVFNYGDHYGLIRYRITVRTTRVRPPVERTLVAEQEFKVVAAVVPRPFDQVALFLGSPEAIVGGAQTNLVAREVQSRRSDWIARLNSALSDPNLAPLAPAIQETLHHFQEIPELEEVTDLGRVNRRKVHPFQFPMVAFLTPGAVSDGRAIELSQIDLATRLEGRFDQIRALDDKAQKAAQALAGAGTDPDAAQRALTAFGDALEALARACRETMRAIHRWQRELGEVTGGAYRGLAQDLARIQPAAMRQRATFLVRPAGAGESPRDALVHLIKAVERRTGTRAIIGSIYVDAPDEALDLTSLTFPGRIVLATPGPVRVGATRRAGPGDHLAIVAGGDLSIEGPVQASLVALRSVTAPAPCTVDGSLIIGDPRPGSLDTLTVRWDPATFSGRHVGGKVQYDAHYMYVSIAPGLQLRRVERAHRLTDRSGAAPR